MTDGADATPIRDAATVVLLRDGRDGLETWMLVRVRQLAFAAGMAVFPGGRVDESDATLPLGPEPAVAAVAGRLGCDATLARSLLGAALRETFEETGVLIGAPTADLASERADVEARRVGFGELLADHGVTLDAAALRPWARWITPPGESRRYDTRFFVGVPPDGLEPDAVTTEAASAAWIGVAEAVDEAMHGRRALLPPTAVTLGELARCATVAEALAAADSRDLRPVQPRLETAADGAVVAVLPDGLRVLVRPARQR